MRGGLAGLALLALSAQVQAAQAPQVVTRQKVDLRVTPDSVGRILMRLPSLTPLEQLNGRFGPWIQVRTAQGVIGWLQMLEVNGAGYLAAPPAPESPQARQSEPTLPTVTVTSGSRPQPDAVSHPAVAERRLQALQTYRADSEAARRFAFVASLELVKLPKVLYAAPAEGVVPPPLPTASQ